MFLNSSRHQFTFKTITIGLQIKNQSHSLAKYITPFSETKTLLTFPEISRDLSGKTLFPLYKISAEEIRTQKKKREMTEERRKERRAQASRPRDYEIPVTARAHFSIGESGEDLLSGLRKSSPGCCDDSSRESFCYCCFCLSVTLYECIYIFLCVRVVRAARFILFVLR